MKPLAKERASGADTRQTRVDRIEAVVVCSDDILLIELGPLLGERFRTRTVDSAVEIAAAVSGTRWIGIVDVDSLPDPHAAIARLETQFPHCPLILIVPRPADWSAAVARGSAVAAVGRQEMVGPRLVEALTSAESRLRADLESHAHAAASIPELGAMSVEQTPARALPWIVGVALLGALAGTGWWMMHRPAPSSSADSAAAGAAATVAADAPGAGADAASASSEAMAASPAPPRPQSILELLSAARIAFRDQRLLLPRADGEPRGDSALELYAQVISQDPSNDEALDGVRRLLAVGKARIQSDLGAGKLDDATRLVGLFRDAGVNNDELSALSASIAAAKPQWLESRAEQSIAMGDLRSADQLLGQLTASGADPGSIAQLRRTLDAKGLELQLAALAAQMHTAIAAGNLLNPPDDARTHLTAMRTLSRTHPLTLAAQRELQAALIDRANLAIHGGQLDVAQRYLTAAMDFGASSSLSDVRRELQAALYAAAHPPPAAARLAMAPSAPLAALPPPATATRSTEPRYIAARPTRALSVTYPRGLTAEGFVVVEFTLQPDGTARNATVVQSNLPTLFGHIATTAVAGGRYDTHGLPDGQPTRARLRLRFQPLQ
jgi:hypothetical protein